MKHLLLSTALAGSLASAPAFADPTAMIGVSFTFGGSQAGQLGISGRILSDDRRDVWVGAIGLTYYPGTNDFGFDAGVGYNFGNTPLTLTYDFMNEGLQVGLGWADLQSDDDAEGYAF